MLRFSQIRSADDIIGCSEYYALALDAEAGDGSGPRLSSVSVLKVSDRHVLREAFLPVRRDGAADGDGDAAGYSPEALAGSLASLIRGAAVAAEPEALTLLKTLLETAEDPSGDAAAPDGEVRFLPVCRLAQAVFPEVQGENPEAMAKALSIPLRDASDPLRAAYLEADLLENCRLVLSGRAVSGRISVTPPAPEPESGRGGEAGDEEAPRRRSGSRKRFTISDEALGRISRSAWRMSPWVFAALAIAVVILAVILFPHTRETTADRETAPIHYLVLSWDKTGKYGTKPAGRSGEDSPIQFRLPYGVYDVLNNNSVPVELHVISEGEAAERIQKEYAEALELGATELEEGADPLDSRVTLRPNSRREITIDVDQYLTLSEEANDLIFFYVSAVPEEPESDTTGQVYAGNVVVYAYVKGTEVRFRRAPSLEGQIIDTLNNGQQVQVLAISGEWTHVQVQDQKGYIFSQYLDTTDPNKRDIAPEAEETEDAVDAEDAANADDAEDAVDAEDAANADDAEDAADAEEGNTAAGASAGDGTSAGEEEAQPAL